MVRVSTGGYSPITSIEKDLAPRKTKISHLME